MTNLKKSICYFFPENPFVFFFLLLICFLFAALDQGYGLFTSRFILGLFTVTQSERLFVMAYQDNKRTNTPLMDALLVPYHSKDHFIHQTMLLSLSLIVPVVMIDIMSCILQHWTMPVFFTICFNHLFQSCVILVSSIAAQFATKNSKRLFYQIISIGFVLTLCTVQSAIKLHFLVILPILGLMILLDFNETKAKQEESLPVIKNSLSGIFTLSRMQIAKEKTTGMALGMGISAFWIYRFIFQLIDLFFLKTMVNPAAFFTWIDVLFVLILVTFFSSRYAFKRIYSAQNMLRVTPIKKSDLFQAASFMGLIIPFVLQAVCVICLWCVRSIIDLNVFFQSSHPYEIIVHAMYLATIPVCIYLICFIVHARNERFTTAFLIGILLFFAGIAFALISFLLQTTFVAKVIFLILLLLGSHLMAFLSYHRMQNIHS